MKKFISENQNRIFEVLKELSIIPAPSHNEEKRAEYCKNLLLSFGAENTYIDEAKNVIFPLNCENSDKITVLCAHTDVVFPDTDTLPYREEDEKIFCPGVSDDTVGAVDVMFMAKYFIENGIKPKNGIMFVCNTCEEGLGNLFGTRTLMKNFEGRIARLISLDAGYTSVYTDCVGSKRMKVTVKTEGGHSYSKFGNENAINNLAKIINDIYSIKVPEIEGSKTTYNVGTIEGGTTVNSIAQEASMLCEFRSDKKEALDFMDEKFSEVFKKACNDKVKVEVETVGLRPCASPEINKKELKRLFDIFNESRKNIIGDELHESKASTDCNIPLSLGIPAIAVGHIDSHGAHTREEYLYKNAIIPCFEYILDAILKIKE